MSDRLPYSRRNTAWADLEFAPATVLDVESLQRNWRAWFELAAAGSGPLCAASTPLLLDLLRDESTQQPLPYCSLVIAADARSRLARQARQDAYLGATPRQVADATGLEGWAFLAAQLDAWADQGPARQAVLVRLLTQLGFYGVAVGLAGAAASYGDTAGEYLAYESARALRQHRRSSAAVLTDFARLAEQASNVSVRVHACTQLISVLLRDRTGEHRDRDWAAYGTALLPELEQAEPWLRALTSSRFWRAAAFQRIGARDTEGARTAIESAYEADDELGHAATTAQQRHAAQENRRLLLDVTVKAGGRLFPAERTRAAAEELLRLDGNEPSARFHVAALAEQEGDPRRAAAEFERGAQAGTLRGAAAAYRAFLCHERLGDREAAARAARLLLELDPAAHQPTTQDGPSAGALV
ncbi:hypothetical protein [Streptacidiphilus sp. P02-A3a]|uniref:hypothetical protein n=1 Tax=Streptacidiphilus sp. P02-A3a TaxID=2704468 RepID=UPI0015FC751C|nr:hypothetical protein [Streptacidiphilus sp. P02-A3a]QMU73405.1 hypothetical protein GXP74_39480 [Streptacidiphilus sp. P02-A3a]